MASGQTLTYPSNGWSGLLISGASREGGASMLDEILELFERDKKKRATGKRSLLGRVTGALSDRDHRPSADQTDPRYVDDRRRRRDDWDERRSDDDDRPRYADDRYERRPEDDDDFRENDYRKPTKKKRFADLLEFD
jgi:hypothetical protein